jgi:methyl-accepting chemotaxis protein
MSEASELLLWRLAPSSAVVLALISYAVIGVWYAASMRTDLNQVINDVSSIQRTLDRQDVSGRLNITEHRVGSLEQHNTDVAKTLASMQAADHETSNKLLILGERQIESLTVLESTSKKIEKLTESVNNHSNGINKILGILQNNHNRAEGTSPY